MQHSLPVPVLLPAQPGEQFSFLSVRMGRRGLHFGGKLDVGLACPLPSSATPHKGVTQREKDSLTLRGLDEGLTSPSAHHHTVSGAPLASAWCQVPWGGADRTSRRGGYPNTGVQEAHTGHCNAYGPAHSSTRGPECQERMGSAGQYGTLGEEATRISNEGGSQASTSLPSPSDQPLSYRMSV